MTPISLTILLQDGNLAASLTDTRLIAKLAHCALPEALLRVLQRDVQELLACCADSGPGKVLRTVASARVRTLGERIFETLLPEPVGSFLRGSPARMVSLQLDAALAWAPWECAALYWYAKQTSRPQSPSDHVCRLLLANHPMRTHSAS